MVWGLIPHISQRDFHQLLSGSHIAHVYTYMMGDLVHSAHDLIVSRPAVLCALSGFGIPTTHFCDPCLDTSDNLPKSVVAQAAGFHYAHVHNTHQRIMC
jgi:hypothetical protein